MEFTAFDQRLPHRTIASRKTQPLGKQAAIHIAEAIERVGVFQSGFGLGIIQPVEQQVQLRAYIRTVFARLADKIREGFRLEYTGVFREHAKQDANQQAFKLMSAETASPDGDCGMESVRTTFCPMASQNKTCRLPAQATNTVVPSRVAASAVGER